MWNPAAAGAPPPVVNPPVQGVPATQQFWPQWQAAIQYYQAASATTTDATAAVTTAAVASNESSNGGGNFIFIVMHELIRVINNWSLQ